MSLDGPHMELGQQVVQQADAAGLNPSGAAWIRDSSSDKWVLELATQLLDSHGPQWVYDRIVPILRVTPLPHPMHVSRLRLASPNEAFWRSVASAFRVDNAAVSMDRGIVKGMVFPAMVLLRSRPPATTAAQDAERLDQRYRDLVHA
jgi:hypothetical protein